MFFSNIYGHILLNHDHHTKSPQAGSRGIYRWYTTGHAGADKIGNKNAKTDVRADVASTGKHAPLFNGIDQTGECSN